MDQQATVAPVVRDAIVSMMNQGVMFSFITARDWNSAFKIMNNIEINMPVGVFNGGAIIDFKTHKILEAYYIPPKTFSEIIRLLKGSQLKISVNFNSNNRVEKVTKVFKSISDEHKISQIKDVLSCSVIAKEKKIIKIYNQILKKQLVGIRINLYSDPFQNTLKILDIVSGYSSKGSAVDTIRRICQSNNELEVIAFGNDENDIEMLKKADVRVGVGKISNNLAMYADICIEYNGGKSVVKFLEDVIERREENGEA